MACRVQEIFRDGHQREAGSIAPTFGLLTAHGSSSRGLNTATGVPIGSSNEVRASCAGRCQFRRMAILQPGTRCLKPIELRAQAKGQKAELHYG